MERERALWIQAIEATYARIRGRIPRELERRYQRRHELNLPQLKDLLSDLYRYTHDELARPDNPSRYQPVEDRFERWDRDWEDVPDDAERVERIDEEYERLEDDEYLGAKRVRRLWPGY
jgi:hypothetical protein